MFSRHSTLSSTKVSAQSCCDKAKQYLTKKQYNNALQLFTEGLKADSKHEGCIQGKTELLRQLAQVRINNQDWTVAQEYLKQAHHLKIDDVAIVNQLAKVRHQYYLQQQKSKMVMSTGASTQESSAKPRVDNLIFQGGGMKGIAYMGALEALEERINMSKVKRFGGASAGAINAFLLGLGYSGDELQKLLKEMDFKLFMDGEFRDKLLDMNARADEIKAKGDDVFNKFKQVKDTGRNPFSGFSGSVGLSKATSDPDFKTMKEGLALLSKQDFGLFPCDMIREDWMEAMSQAKTGIAYINFEEWHQLGLKPIYFVSVNINTGRIEVFSHETTPKAIVTDAMRCSMSIPLFFTPHRIYVKQQGKRVLQTNSAWYVDGGMLDNYPLWLFDKACYWQKSPVRPQAIMRNPFTLGLRLATTEKKKFYEGTTKEPLPTAPENLFSFMWSLVDSIYSKQNSDHLKQNEQDRTIYIDYLEVKTTQFDLNEADQEGLAKSGRKGVDDYFNHRLSQGNEKSPLDEALSNKQNARVLALVHQGKYACQDPAEVVNLLKEALKSKWVDRPQVKDDLTSFEAYHQQGLTQEPTAPGFFH